MDASYIPAGKGGNGSPTPPSGSPQPGSAAPNRTLVANNVQNDSVITKRGEAGVSAGTMRRLPNEDRRNLSLSTPDETSDINTEVDKLVKSTDQAYVRSIQKRLVEAGLLSTSDVMSKNGTAGPGDYLPGYADTNTIKAYAILLEEASRSGRTVDEAFSARKASVIEAGGVGSAAVKRQALSIALTSFLSVEQGVKQLAPGIVGRNVSPAEIQAITSGYNALQTSAQTQDYNNSPAIDNGGVGGSFTKAPDLGDYIRSQLASAHPDEAHAMGEANALNVFFDLLHGSKQFTNTQGLSV